MVIKGNLEVGVRPPGERAVYGGHCEGYALYDLTYSWRTSPEAVWTVGSEQCTRQFDVPGVGSWFLEVEVRDRWGLADRTNLTLTWMH